MILEYMILSYTLSENIPLYGSTPKPKILAHTSIDAGDASNSFMLALHNHTGTHIDAPGHFIKDGKRITEYGIEELIFHNPVILDCPKSPGEQIEKDDIVPGKIKGADIVFFHTGFGKLREKDPDNYRTQNPGITPEAILEIRKRFPGIRCIGVDSISISCFQRREDGRTAHRNAFKKIEGSGEPLLIIEDLNLEGLNGREKPSKVIVIPWQISDIDSAPCTVIAEIT
jgi:arylformamidase